MIKKHILSLLAIFIVFIGIVATNLSFNTSIMGWDNLLPELGFKFNIFRSVFSVWEEYQGLGLLAGNGHAASIIHQLILLLSSIVIPTNLLRSFYIFTMLLVGGIGTYFLSYHILNENSKNPVLFEKRNIASSLVASLFYLLNLATVQNFYVPFEPFITHFGLIPWLLFSAYRYIKEPTSKSLVLFVIISILSIPQGQVPTVFVVYLFSLVVLLITVCFRSKKIIVGIKTLLITLALNAFWLLPFIYFTLTNTTVALTAKINQMATPTVIAQNKEFGGLLDTILLKGFWFNNVDPDFSGNTRYMLMPWREHLNNPLVITAGIILFGIILFGVIMSLIKKSRINLAFLILFIFSFTMLALTTFPFSFVDALFRNIPLFNQVFRFPFTKFATLLALTYALFLAMGVRFLLALVSTYSKRLLFVVPIIFIAIITFVSFPIFKGNLIYQKEQLKLPTEYLQTFDYFKSQDQNARIANLPQQTFWGWNFYSWGYGGSGFLWYGIKQPILDRAFDVWSQTSENYYNELSYALYSKNPQLFESVLNKYQISYLLFDQNVIAPSSPKSLFYSETDALLAQIPAISKSASFGKITIYKVKLQQQPQNFLFSAPLLPTSNGYEWGDNDVSYQTLRNYTNNSTPSQYFPFSSLFTNKKLQKDFTIQESTSDIIFSKKLPKISQAILTLPSYTSEKVLPIDIQISKDSNGGVSIIALISLPQVTIDNVVVSGNTTFSYPLFNVSQATGQYVLNNNGIKQITLDLQKPTHIRSYLFLDSDNFISLQQKETGQTQTQSIAKSYLRNLPELSQRTVELKNISSGTVLKISIPKNIDSYYSYSYKGTDFQKNTKDCNVFRNGKNNTTTNKNGLILTSINDSLCSSVFSPTLPHAQGYLIHLSSSNQQGDPLHFWMLNDNQGYAPIEVDLEKGKNSDFFIVPPMEQYGLSYSFHADNISIGNDEAKNTIQGMDVLTLPYSFLAHMSITSPFKSTGSPISFTSTHPNESLYTFTPSTITTKPSTIILSQSYDPGWHAYVLTAGNQKSKIRNFFDNAFPFLFGQEVKTHVKVNNWENGWTINSQLLALNSQLIIVYLPQYLEYAGFIVLLVLIVILPMLFYSKRHELYFKNKTERLKQDLRSILSR